MADMAFRSIQCSAQCVIFRDAWTMGIVSYLRDASYAVDRQTFSCWGKGGTGGMGGGGGVFGPANALSGMTFALPYGTVLPVIHPG
jgi:hypothetical protein